MHEKVKENFFSPFLNKKSNRDILCLVELFSFTLINKL